MVLQEWAVVLPLSEGEGRLGKDLSNVRDDKCGVRDDIGSFGMANGVFGMI